MGAEGKEHDFPDFTKMLYSQKESRKVAGLEEAKQKNQVWGHKRTRQKSLWLLQELLQHQEWELRSLTFYCQQTDVERFSKAGEALHMQRYTTL